MDYAMAVGPCTTLVICLLYVAQSTSSIGANVWLSDWTNEATEGNQQNNTSLRLGVYATLGFLQGEPRITFSYNDPPLQHFWAVGRLQSDTYF